VTWDAQKALKQQILMLSGDEGILRGRALHDLVQLACDGDDYDLEFYDADASTSDTWIGSVGTAPFLSPKRTVIVRHVCRSDAHKAFKSGKLPDTALLILVADEEVGDQDKQRKMATNRAGWEKAVNAAGGMVASFKLEPKEVSALLIQEAKRLEKKISPRAVEALKELTGSSLSRGIEELEKLAVYSGKETEIKESDVRALAVPSPEWNVFSLIDSITGTRTGEALKQLRILVGSGAKVEQAAHANVVPQLSRVLRFLWQARACVEARCTPENAPPDLIAQWPDRHLGKEKDFVQSKFMAIARNLDYPTIAKLIRAASDVDAKLKGMLPSFTPLDSLEQLVLEMIECVREGKKAQQGKAVGARG
jgi:DNA polymerase III delta subunit